MATAIVRFRVADYDHWRRVFDALALTRLEHGITAASVHRDAGDPARVVTILAARSLAAARAWTASDVLREAMAEAGVIGRPEVELLEDA
ncbi:MAG: antibiotic biosynthesis monooxygenase [Rhizobiales bacterium]|nr:antibiotic biosynthesis monooxygenase [Hyphomicrobiales bacterium]